MAGHFALRADQSLAAGHRRADRESGAGVPAGAGILNLLERLEDPILEGLEVTYQMHIEYCFSMLFSLLAQASLACGFFPDLWYDFSAWLDLGFLARRTILYCGLKSVQKPVFQVRPHVLADCLR